MTLFCSYFTTSHSPVPSSIEDFVLRWSLTLMGCNIFKICLLLMPVRTVWLHFHLCCLNRFRLSQKWVLFESILPRIGQIRTMFFLKRLLSLQENNVFRIIRLQIQRLTYRYYDNNVGQGHRQIYLFKRLADEYGTIVSLTQRK